MSVKLVARSKVEPNLWVDTPEDIAEMMAEAARVDAMFQSGAISTLFPYALSCVEPEEIEIDSVREKASA